MPDDLPHLIAHADWSSNPKKRWMCVAERGDGQVFRVGAPEPVGEPTSLLRRLRERAGGGAVAAGFDFPIGVPSEYARRAGVEDFPDLLPQLGKGRWSDFYSVCGDAQDIRLTRPFYPMRPGGTRQHHLADALGVDDMDALRRLCERATPTRGAASSLFWTLGGKQVGKAAILGWREVLGPALADVHRDVSIWPFHGDLHELFAAGGTVVAETYPAEACLHIGLSPPGRGWSKTSQAGRIGQSAGIEAWASRRPVTLDEALGSSLRDGFGPSRDAEDPFDAVLGALSMVEVILGYRPAGAPRTAEVRRIEGWILGQASAT